jgi:hypothetical protein
VTLAEPVARATIRLVVSQTPEGETEHRILARRAPGDPLVRLHTFRGATSDGQALIFDVDLDQPISVLRIETRASPSWVAWREIQVLAGPPE